MEKLDQGSVIFLLNNIFVLSLSLVVWMGILQQENQQQSQSDAQKHA